MDIAQRGCILGCDLVMFRTYIVAATQHCTPFLAAAASADAVVAHFKDKDEKWVWCGVKTVHTTPGPRVLSWLLLVCNETKGVLQKSCRM